jgi:4-hydroxybenzoate polyprenyltransferase
LKRIPLLSSVVLAAAWIAMFATGFSLLTDAHLRDNFPKSLFWLLLISLPLGLQVKDLKDVEGDCRVGVWTMPVLLGPVWGRIWCAVSAVVAFALPAFGLDRLPCVSLACAVFAGWAVLTQPPARAHRWLCGAAILLVLWVGVSGSVVTGR